MKRKNKAWVFVGLGVFAFYSVIYLRECEGGDHSYVGLEDSQVYGSRVRWEGTYVIMTPAVVDGVYRDDAYVHMISLREQPEGYVGIYTGRKFGEEAWHYEIKSTYESYYDLYDQSLTLDVTEDYNEGKLSDSDELVTIMCKGRNKDIEVEWSNEFKEAYGKTVNDKSTLEKLEGYLDGYYEDIDDLSDMLF